MAKEYKITAIRLKELETELNYLKTVREKEVAEHLKEARSFGDLSENSEYDEARDEQGRVAGRVAEINYILTHAVIIDENDGSDKIGLGCTVKVYSIEDDEEEVYAIVGSQEADPKLCKISDDSPFGRAMVGHCRGDEVTVDAPIGELHYRVLSVER